MNTFLAFGLPGGSEWFIIFLIVVLLFGAKKLPELARGVGRSLAEFQKARTDVEREINKAADDIEEEKKQAAVSPIADSAKKS
ncbi:MAG: twin-arginine translocase TatA/TatE family subunit [Blastochloris sp.]|jgi:sec-independent protein translocase protein TatA|nr:twin-arginine translocase TatA/TatE family subunit [Blastochloris sp.]